MDKTSPDIITQILGGVARHALTTFAGGLVAEGVIKDSDTTMFVGAGMALAGVAWSWWQKVGQAKALEELKNFKAMVVRQKAATAVDAALKSSPGK